MHFFLLLFIFPQDFSPKSKHNPDSPLLIEEEEENFYNAADISELSDTDQSESKSSCDRPRCDKCVSAGSSSVNPRPNSNCGCGCSLTGHRPALRTKNFSNSNNEAGLLKSASGIFYGNECLSPKPPKSPKSPAMSHLMGQSNSSPYNANILPSVSFHDNKSQELALSDNLMSPPPPLLQVCN